jgi:hypothetical protein
VCITKLSLYACGVNVCILLRILDDNISIAAKTLLVSNHREVICLLNQQWKRKMLPTEEIFAKI